MIDLGSLARDHQTTSPLFARLLQYFDNKSTTLPYNGSSELDISVGEFEELMGGKNIADLAHELLLVKWDVRKISGEPFWPKYCFKPST